MKRLKDPETALLKAAKEIIIEEGLEGLNARAIAKKPDVLWDRYIITTRT